MTTPYRQMLYQTPLGLMIQNLCVWRVMETVCVLGVKEVDNMNSTRTGWEIDAEHVWVPEIVIYAAEVDGLIRKYEEG